MSDDFDPQTRYEHDKYYHEEAQAMSERLDEMPKIRKDAEKIRELRAELAAANTKWDRLFQTCKEVMRDLNDARAEVDRLVKRCEEARKFLEQHSHSWDCCRCIVCGHFEKGYYDDFRHTAGCELQEWLEGKP